jgi:hypothetical protein
MRGLAIIAALCALAVPAWAAENNVPRSPQDAEHESRINGPAFEHKLRRNPQLYPNLPPKPSAEPQPPSRPRAPPPRFEVVTPPGYVGRDG